MPLDVLGQPMIDDLQREYAMRFERNESYRRAVWRFPISDFFAPWIPADPADRSTEYGSSAPKEIVQREFDVRSVYGAYLLRQRKTPSRPSS